MVSRETSGWSLERFLGWYGNTLNEKNSSVSPYMTRESAVLFFLSKRTAEKSLFFVSCDSEALSFGLYSICYNLSPQGSYYLPGKDSDPLAVPGFLSENQRYAEEALSVLSSPEVRGVVFSTKKALKQYVLSRDKGKSDGIALRVGKKIKMKFLLEQLKKWGYTRADSVKNPLYYTVRGGILDVFPVQSRNPIRIEFFGDTVDSIRLFNPYSQRTIKVVDSAFLFPRFQKEDREAPSLFSFYSSNKNFYSVVSSPSDSLNKKTIKIAGSVSINTNIYPYSEKVLLEMVTDKTINSLFAFSPQAGGLSLPSSLPKDCVFNRVCGSIKKGFILKDFGVVVFGSDSLSGVKDDIKTRWMISGNGARRPAGVLDISDLKWGQPLVHESFGVGEYRGLEVAGGADCIKIKYKDGGVVFVPVESFEKIHKLVGVPKGSIKITSLKSGSWKRKKGAVKKYVDSIAGDLIKSYSQRQGLRDFKYEKRGVFYRAVCESFSFTETRGQLSAIEDVLADMDTSQPLDRLICGDVGFGKTEVAIRASVRAVESGKAVFMLAPTTVLANQHYIGFVKRFSPLGVSVELLSRFRSKAEQKEIIDRAIQGSVDILVGTHRLLSDDVKVENLGLFIIDEEHRFGVKQKEKIKKIKPFVDVLSFTATPIPRTLKQSLVGLKNISIIDTPPKSRRPVKTVVSYFDWKKIFKAVELEINRGGQLYFVHNDIDTLSFLANKIQNEFEKIKVHVAHGQLSSRKLEPIMLSFFKNEIDVLCCTTIVGSGLDVSSANTIIINNAHYFGLSQLYQLRGRVGRSPSQAYCYLLVPKSLKLNEPSFQRLKTMEQNTALGSGYKIALKDLDIRGPGNLFGEKQSGAVSGVGFHLYNKILKEAIDEARGKVKRESPTNIIFHYSCGFPESYVPLLEDRLYFYQSLALSNTKESVCDIESELKDRYGSLPDEAFFLVSAAKLRVFLSGTSIAKLSLQNDFVELFFKSIEPFLSVEKLLLGIEKSFNLNKNTVVLKNVSGGLLSAKITELSVARASFGLFESSLSRLFLS